MSTMTDHQVTLRHDLRPGDLGRVVEQHGVLYAAEYGFDHTFEAYAAETLGDFGRTARPERDRLWLAERDGRLLGSIGSVGREEGVAQLRWLLVHPDARGLGLGRRLVDEVLTFCRTAGYRSVFLWTVSLLTAAINLYLTAGFRLTEQHETVQWGATLIEQRYDLSL